jgi:AcrR family transcriptional regulator
MANSKQPRPRADPRNGRLPKVQRREQLLSAAREVFVESGYHAASMDEIAARAGVTKPVLYQHFASKRDLYLAILDEGAGLFLASIEAALRSTQDNQQRVYATVRAYFHFVAHDDADYRLLFETDLGNLPEVARRTNRVADKGARMVSEVIAADTGLDQPHALLLAHGLLGMAQVSAQQWLREGKRMPADEAAGFVAGLGWQGISGHPLTRQPSRPARPDADQQATAGAAAPARERPPARQASAAKPTRRSATDPTST